MPELRQALLQLLGNALKYTDQGVIEVQTEVTERELVIFISDTGVGMSAETLTALFQPQSGPALARRGPGLGLKLAKRLIELHRGRIWANSIKGVGSTFCVALPLHSPQEMLEATHISPARPPRR
ncbi:MAG: ATP-binding protein, partial [Nitrosomonas sp.]|nr:ATP-binding protein [Nitrosomonas sp.]